MALDGLPAHLTPMQRAEARLHGLFETTYGRERVASTTPIEIIRASQDNFRVVCELVYGGPVLLAVGDANPQNFIGVLRTVGDRLVLKAEEDFDIITQSLQGYSYFINSIVGWIVTRRVAVSDHEAA